MTKRKTLPFKPPRRTIWVADLLTLEELFEELYTWGDIDRKTYTRYLALREALYKLAEWVLLKLADRLIFEGEPPDFEWPQVPPDMPDEA
jgi:hypothetical protein